MMMRPAVDIMYESGRGSAPLGRNFAWVSYTNVLHSCGCHKFLWLKCSNAKLRPHHQYLLSHLSQLESLHYSHFGPTLPSLISLHWTDPSQQSSKKSGGPHRVPELMPEWQFSKYMHIRFLFKYFRVKHFCDNTCSSGNENYLINETRILISA